MLEVDWVKNLFIHSSHAESACQDVVCAPEQVCPEGGYYEPGPQVTGECCPREGVCWCDPDLCPEEPDCPEGFEPVVVVSANDTDSEELCCDVYECKPGMFKIYSHAYAML